MQTAAVEHTRGSIRVMIGREGIKPVLALLSGENMSQSFHKELEAAQILRGKVINFPQLVPLGLNNNDTRNIIKDYIKNDGMRKVVETYADKGLDKESAKRLVEAKIMVNGYICMSSLVRLEEPVCADKPKINILEWLKSFKKLTQSRFWRLRSFIARITGKELFPVS